ncbi:MAG: DUF2130 domain-containing protein [Deltaproteobacteria bacterium]|nr:DUF2130 domain-containing protein [Deltaproteobacteria bacterium]
MTDQKISCPHCGRVIPLTETLSNQIKEDVRKEYEKRDVEKELEFKRREDEITRKNRQIEEEKKAVEEMVSKRLTLEKAKLMQEASKRAKDEMEVAFRDLKEDNARKDRLLGDARSAELELRRKTRELEEEKKALDLKVAREIDAEREKIRRSTLEIFYEEHRLKDLEKDKKIHDMLKTIEELKRKGEQGSMQTQGEVLEMDLEALLKARFPVDVIEPVAKGIRGADIVQRVYTRAGAFCGTIAWESKRTKAWNDEWIGKLKDDQREIKAEAAIIVTETLPKGITTFGLLEGVWVTDVATASNLAEVLRVMLIQLAHSRLSAVGKGEKMEAIYNYLSGPEFKHKIEAIVESFTTMKEDLDREKNAVLKLWAKREKQIERVQTNTLCMYGDMQGIIGASLPEIKSLELGAGDGSEDEERQ